ncbi:MAG: excinuclease ABC subunit UvrA [Patescibacteria group bacterium]
MSIHSTIRIRGARVHNLKNVSIDIPHNALVVFTGLSGSGKSSLAFDTIYAEGQRRFMESLSSFSKQFMENLGKPDVDQIEGLPPTIAIDQRTSSASPRSTVGTATEVYDYLRLLFSRIGRPHCPSCAQPIRAHTKQQIINDILEHLKARPDSALLFAPLKKKETLDLDRITDELQRLGYTHVRVDSLMIAVRDLADALIDQSIMHDLDVLIDRLGKSDLSLGDSERLVSSLTTALELGDGCALLTIGPKKEEHLYSERLTCPACNITIPSLEPRNFSFNNPLGACSSCAGLGYLLKFDPELLIPNTRLTIAQGAIQPLNKMYANANHYLDVVDAALAQKGVSIHTPIEELTAAQKTFLLEGDKKSADHFGGIIPYLEGKYKETDSEYLQRELEGYMRIFGCAVCEGRRLKPEMLAVRIGDLTVDRVVSLPIPKLLEFFRLLLDAKKSPLSVSEQKIANPVLKEALTRVSSLIDVGLSYLILDRSMVTLSGGEAQRVKLANHISSSLVGVVYVLDEPSIGLHPRDTEQLIGTLKKLRDSGNTVLVVEHDKNIIMAADLVVDVGPRAGKDGGHITAQGTPAEIIAEAKSLTGKYLSGALSVTVPKKTRTGSGKSIAIKGASAFNLKNVDASIPLGTLTFVTGVSGSGKSTLVIEILAKALLKKFSHAKDEPGAHRAIEGLEHIDKAVVIDQSPIGRTPRSNPVTYTNIFTPIRELFTELPESKIKGFKPGHFSFNVKGGRCESCQGEGMMRIDMRFLSDVYVECGDCHGKRYNAEALEVHVDGLTIADVLNLTVNEALAFFKKTPPIHDKLKTLSDVGLGYIRLGQPANTLSGGEAQRIKLSAELSRRSTGKTLYILDEPTTGLHFEDIKQLLNILHQLVDKGNTVLVIEHNSDIIKNADWVIDLGPDGGEGGGTIVATGTPADIQKCAASWTGKYL